MNKKYTPRIYLNGIKCELNENKCLKMKIKNHVLFVRKKRERAREKNSPNKSSLNDTLCRVMLHALDRCFFMLTELRTKKL